MRATAEVAFITFALFVCVMAEGVFIPWVISTDLLPIWAIGGLIFLFGFSLFMAAQALFVFIFNRLRNRHEDNRHTNATTSERLPL